MKLRKMLIAAGLAALAIAAATPASAGTGGGGGGPENNTCDDIVSGSGWETKVEPGGEQSTISYTAPDGYLVDMYCVKTGSVNQSDYGPVIVPVDPPSASVLIDYPEPEDKQKAISHYVIHLIADESGPEEVTPAEPTWTDPCGPDNAYWTVPQAGTGYSYTESTWNGYLVVKAIADEDYVFPGGKTEIKWKMKDSGEECPPEEVVPEEPVWTDMCGPDNAYWTVPDDTAKYTYMEFTWNGYLVVKATAADGYVFPGGESTMKWKKMDSGEECPLIEVTPDEPVWTDMCGPDNAYWTVPEDGTGYSYSESTSNGYLVVTATAESGYTFADGKTELEWKGMDSGEECPPVEVTPDEPTWVDECGADNAYWMLPADTDEYSYSASEEGGYLVVTATAADGYVFPSGESTMTWQDVDSNVPCPVTPATLNGTIVGEVCTADAPYLGYDIVLDDPDGTVSSTTATITFVHPTNTARNWTAEVPVGSGRILWPGASVDEDGVANGWPGYRYNAGQEEWVNIGARNFGWTRMPDTEVIIEVNPSATFEVSYPPATPECNSAPPQEIIAVLGAPAATPVVAQASYTG